MKRTLLISVFFAISMFANAQSFVKYERTVEDGHVWHNCINAFEMSDGNIVMMEECCDTIKDYSGVYTESVNLIKLNQQGVLVDSVKVDFTATSRNSPFLRNPYETGNNVMSGLYSKENDELYYKAVFFNDDLSISSVIDVAFPVEGFTISYKSMVDNDGNLILMSKKKDSKDTYIFVKMNVYGEISLIKNSVSDNYENIFPLEKSLYIHSIEPLQYGCYFNYDGGLLRIFVLDEDFEILDEININSFTEENQTYKFSCSQSEIMQMKDGSILMTSTVYETKGYMNQLQEYLQVTKFNKEYEVVDYARLACRPYYGDGGYFYVNTCKSIIEDRNGNVYVIWHDVGSKYTVSFLNDHLDLMWSSVILDIEGYDTGLLYGAFVTNDDKLVVYGDHVKYEKGYYGVCFIVENTMPMGSSDDFQTNTGSYSICPNPASDFVKLSAVSSQPSVVRIYNTLGMLVDEFEMNSGEIEINVLEYRSGMYFVEIQTEEGSYVEKMMVE